MSDFDPRSASPTDYAAAKNALIRTGLRQARSARHLPKQSDEHPPGDARSMSAEDHAKALNLLAPGYRRR